MPLTERKNCDICQAEVVHLKEDPTKNIEEECLPCGWRSWIENWEISVKENGLEKSKQSWIDCKEGNEEIMRELNPEEKEIYENLAKWTDKYFELDKKEVPERKNQELDYQPYLIGGCIGGGIIAFIWLIVVLIRRD